MTKGGGAKTALTVKASIHGEERAVAKEWDREGRVTVAGPGWSLAVAAAGHGLGTDAPSLAVCAFPYLLAFTTDSMEIRLVVNGNLVHTAVVPQLQLVASRVSGRETSGGTEGGWRRQRCWVPTPAWDGQTGVGLSPWAPVWPPWASGHSLLLLTES